jgi:potassium efflux system protein
LSDKYRRIDINVGVKYGSDVKKVKELLLKCANHNIKIINEPEPIVLFQNFGNSSLDFTLRCWAENIDNWFYSQSELRFAINKVFEENNITIPFPQTDLNFKNKLLIDKSDSGAFNKKENPTTK